MIRVPVLTVAITLFSVTAASANWDEYCPALDIRGPVKSITVYDSRIDRKTGEVIGQPRKMSDTTVAYDRRKVTQVTYEVDTPYEAMLKMFPTDVMEYDASGRLLRHTLKLDGTSDHHTTRCEYDRDGRVLLVTKQSKNPEFDGRTIAYTYGRGWRRQRWQSPMAVVVTTQELDERDRPVREVKFHEVFNETSARTFEYEGTVTRTCWSATSEPDICSTTRKDAQGSLVELKVTAGSSRTVIYEYDPYGNWISERAEHVSVLAPDKTIRAVELKRRTITYW